MIAYSEIYNAIQTGVIDAAENEAAGIQQMKFYEVGPEISLTAHTITVRPIAFSGKTFRRLPQDLQAAILKAGKEAGSGETWSPAKIASSLPKWKRMKSLTPMNSWKEKSCFGERNPC